MDCEKKYKDEPGDLIAHRGVGGKGSKKQDRQLSVRWDRRQEPIGGESKKTRVGKFPAMESSQLC